MTGRLFDVSVEGWERRRRRDPAANALADRHYSRRSPGIGQISGPYKVLVLLTPDEQALWVTTWPRKNLDGLDAWRCAIFRNEGPALSSDLIRSAMAATYAEWPTGNPPDEWVTYVNSRAVTSSNPGYCFLAAEWTRDRSYSPGARQRGLIRLRHRFERPRHP